MSNNQILFPPSKPSTPSHLQIAFPRRAVSVSDSPEDIASKNDTLTGEGVLPVHEYSWEWGEFPQSSLLQTPSHFTPSVLKRKGEEMRPEVDEDELVLAACHEESRDLVRGRSPWIG